MDQSMFAGIWVVTALFAFCLPIIAVEATHTRSKKECDRHRVLLSTEIIGLMTVITLFERFSMNMLITDGLFLLFGFLGFVKAYNNARKSIVRQLLAARELGDFAVEHFRELDYNCDGVVDILDLSNPETKRRLTTLDPHMLETLKLSLGEIGHAVGAGSAALIDSQNLSAPFVATLWDFAVYHDRLAERWGDWLK